MISKSKALARLGLFAALATATLLFLFVFDPESPFGPPVVGVVVANVEQVAESPTPEDQIQVRLSDGSVVNALVPAHVSFPLKLGTVVRVAPHRSRMFGKRSYWLIGPGAGS